MFGFIIFFLIIIPFLIITFLFLLCKSTEKQALISRLRPTYSVLTVKNSEETIEGIVRSIAWRTLTGSEDAQELIVLDLGSEDQTFLILKKLAKEYPFIHPMKKNEYIRFVSDL